MSKWFARLHFLLLSFNMYANAVSPVLTLCVGLHSQEHIPITAAHLLLRSAFEETAFETLIDGGAREKREMTDFRNFLAGGGGEAGGVGKAEEGGLNICKIVYWEKSVGGEASNSESWSVDFVCRSIFRALAQRILAGG